MNHQGFFELLGDRDLLSKCGLLDGMRGVVVVKVEPRLADCDDRGILAGFVNRVTELWCEMLGVVRMNADSRGNSIRMLVGELDRRGHRLGILSTSDRRDALHPRVCRTRQHIVELFMESRVIEVTVGVEQHGVQTTTQGDSSSAGRQATPEPPRSLVQAARA